MSSKLRLVQQLKKNSEKDLFDLFTPEFIEKSEVRNIIKPKIQGNYILPAFFEACKKIIGIDMYRIDSLKTLTTYSLHPSSHNSMHNFSYHFEAFSPEEVKAGAMFSKERSNPDYS